MQSKVYLDESATTLELQSDGSTGPETMDPVLSNIRSAIDPNAAQKIEQHTKPNKTEETTEKLEGQVQKILQPVGKKLPVRWLFERVSSFLKRPDATRILSVLILLALFALQPGFVLFLFLIAVLIGLVLYLSFGPDRVQDWVHDRYRRLHERDPEGAKRIRRRAAAASKKITKIIDKFPEKWTRGLYIPDFEEPKALPEKFKTDPFERLASQKN